MNLTLKTGYIEVLEWDEAAKDLNIVVVKPKREVGGSKVILTQEALSEPNTKYIIRYVFDLRNRTLQMPVNSILEIDGGKINNGFIQSNGSKIRNPNRVSIGTAELLGEWDKEYHHRVLTEALYEALGNIEEDVIYFIKEEE